VDHRRSTANGGSQHQLAVQFKNQWWGHIGANGGDFTETYNDREARGGPAVRKSGEAEVWTGFETDRRNAISGGLFAGMSKGDDGRSSG